MKPGFFEGVALAFVAALVSTVAFEALAMVFYSGMMLKFFISLGSFSYIGYLLWRSPERNGRLSITAAWLSLSGLAWILSPSLIAYTLIQLIMIWLVRSLYYHSNLITALADLGLIGLGLLTAAWSWLQTGSVFIAIWCFFLIQALYVLLPQTWSGSISNSGTSNNRVDPFEQAHRSAELAVKKLANL